jgi:hypothetical protein
MKGSDELHECVLFEGRQLLEQVQQFPRYAALAEFEAREQGRELDIETAHEFSQSQQRRREGPVLEASDRVCRDAGDFGENLLGHATAPAKAANVLAELPLELSVVISVLCLILDLDLWVDRRHAANIASHRDGEQVSDAGSHSSP